MGYTGMVVPGHAALFLEGAMLAKQQTSAQSQTGGTEMNNTPRTDALFDRHCKESSCGERNVGTAIRQVMELMNHARQLERELAAMTAERDALAKRVAELECNNKLLEALAYPDGPSGDAGVSAKDYVAMRERVAALEKCHDAELGVCAQHCPELKAAQKRVAVLEMALKLRALDLEMGYVGAAGQRVVEWEQQAQAALRREGGK